MAQFTSAELGELRSAICRNVTPQTWTKAQFAAALQAIEDRVRLPATQNAISNDIETAAPGIFSAGQKATLFGVWCLTAARRLGVTD